ncbi:MAG: serine/threonine protein phosphatase [Oscillospiraceae bacterium]|nr:serine/threonine protein phosphatase [Oscillospiraceae bacterium]
MLTFGNAIGEIVLNPEKNKIIALYNSSLENIKISSDKNPLSLSFYYKDGISFVPVKFPQLILFSALNPPPGEIKGVSLLNGLPFVTETLLKIYKSIALNFDRVGNVRFAVTYKPPNYSSDLSCAKDIASSIANEWSCAMNSSSDTIKDFVAVGDVDIKVIGSDNQILDTNIPVRQMLEQIVAKTGIPPFLLGLSWSTSERMSKQQAEILTSELEGYRRILTPVISKIISFWLKLNQFSEIHTITWNTIHLQDEVELARAALLNAQANKL